MHILRNGVVIYLSQEIRSVKLVIIHNNLDCPIFQNVQWFLDRQLVCLVPAWEPSLSKHLCAELLGSIADRGIGVSLAPSILCCNVPEREKK